MTCEVPGGHGEGGLGANVILIRVGLDMFRILVEGPVDIRC